MKKKLHIISATISVLSALMLAISCKEGDPSRKDDGKIHVVDGKVRFYISQDESSPIAVMGRATTDFTGYIVNVSAEDYPVMKEEGTGRFYTEVKATSANVYNAMLMPPGAEKWYGANIYSDIRLPWSQFWLQTAQRLSSCPMYASYSEQTGNKLKFNNGFALLDLVVKGDAPLTSIKLESIDGKVIAGTANYILSDGQLVAKKGESTIILNCTDYGLGVETGRVKGAHFHIPIIPGDYPGGFDVTICDMQHKMSCSSIGGVSLKSGQVFTTSIDHTPDADLIWYEGFDNFVWGGDIVGGSACTGYAPDAAKVTGTEGATLRSGYEEATVQVPYDMPGSSFIQPNDWNSVSGKKVAESHLMSGNYTKSRNIADFNTMFRAQEYRGYVSLGAGVNTRGILTIPANGNIARLRNVSLSFDLCLYPGFNDELEIEITNGGYIREVRIDGRKVALDDSRLFFKSRTSYAYISPSSAGITVPKDLKSAKKWQKCEVIISGATDGTYMYLTSRSADNGTHGIFVDNITLRALQEDCFSTGNLRVLYWNIQNGMWADQANDYNNFVAWVKKYDPDVCVWCEASTIYKNWTGTSIDQSLRYLPSHWGDLARRYGHQYDAIGGFRDNYPQVITSKLPIRTLLKITDTATSGKPISHGAGLFSITVNGQEVYFVTLHTWPQAYGYGVSSSKQEESKNKHEGDLYRQYEMEYILSHTKNDSRYSAHPLWLMMGDFNSRSRKDNWFYGYPENDTRLLCQDVVLGKSDYVDIINERAPEKWFISSTGGDSRIDYMYASPSMYGKVCDACILIDKWTANSKSTHYSSFWEPSDHRPILVDFKF